MARLKTLLSFPDPVNEVAARVVAGAVVVMCAVTIALGQPWVIVALVYGFWARVLTGPRLSPLGQLATRVVAPRLAAPRRVPGPPKRFAQGMGVAFSTVALVLWFGFSQHTVSLVLIGMLGTAASLESFLGYCLGCRTFALLMKVGVIPEHFCMECVQVGVRRAA
ncbi:MAG: DUF4395 domain-containing protein [Acidimicrobiales bacterium]